MSVPAERWRQPLNILATETDSTRARWNEHDERWEEVVAVTFDAESIERLKQGRACLRCYEPQETAYPEKCAAEWCGYEIRKNHDRDFAMEFDGNRRLGPSTSTSEELDKLAEDFHPRNTHVAGSKILVPDWVRSA